MVAQVHRRGVDVSKISVMPSGVSVAGLGRRLLAALIDGLPIGLISAGASAYLSYGKPSATVAIVVGIVAGVLTLVWAVYVWWGYATRGAGPGAKAMQIEVLGLKDGRPIGWGRYFLRELVWAASGLVVIPWIVLVVMMVTHQRRQGWHDLAAKAVVVKRQRALESGGSVTRSSVQAANTVGLPAHLVGSSFAGTSGSSGSATELPSSIGYTPTALGSAAGSGPIASVPAALAPSAAPLYQPAPQGPPPVPTPPPASAPSGPAVPWSQWGVQPPSATPVPLPVQPVAPPVQPSQPVAPVSAAPAGYPQSAPPVSTPPLGQPQSSPQAGPGYGPGAFAPQPSPAQPSAPAYGQGSPYGQASPYAPAQPTYPPQSVPGAAPYPAQSVPPAGPGFPAQSSPAAFPPPSSFPPAADDYGGTHLASRSSGVLRGADEGWQLRLDDGRVIDVDGLVLIGRNPVGRPDESPSQLISAGADSRMVSKTHLAVATDQRGLYVTDRGSTNGTAVAGAQGALEPCAPGDKVRLREGQLVSFGDRSFEVRRTH